MALDRPRSGLLAGRRIALVTASISRMGGGVAEAVQLQARMIHELGGLPHIIALRDRWSDEDMEKLVGLPSSTCTAIGPAQFGFAPGLARALKHIDCDLLHLHGIWQYPSAVASNWAARTGRPYIISPHGMLDPWILAGGKWKKALARWGYEYASWRRANTFHALTEHEARDITQATGRNKSIVIPNAAPDITAGPIRPRAPKFLYLGRIHPKKNIGALVQAWKMLHASDELGEAQLIIAGWGARADVADLRASIAAAPQSIRFVGPAYGKEKQHLMETARFLVLPSIGEGLPMAVLEAWAAGTPTIMTKACNLDEGFAAAAAIECGQATGAIAAALRTALALESNAWLTMANSARTLASGPFSRQQIAARWQAAYAGLLDRQGER